MYSTVFAHSSVLRLIKTRCSFIRHSIIVWYWDVNQPVFPPSGSPLLKNLTIAILKLSESGELTHLRQKWWSSSCAAGSRANTSEALRPHDLRGLFLLLGLGLGVGLLLALLELLSGARNQAKDGKVGESFIGCDHQPEVSDAYWNMSAPFGGILMYHGTVGPQTIGPSWPYTCETNGSLPLQYLFSA